MPAIRLGELQGACSEPFRQWRLATSLDSSIAFGLAKEARKQIYREVKAAIPAAGLEGHGLYLFANLKLPDTLAQVVYVGLVNGARHTLRKRMWDHLAKELSSLNTELASMEVGLAKIEIEQLLLAVLPNSSKIQDYCRTHLKGREMSRADSVLLFPVSAPAAVIDEAETALIQSAVPGPDENRSIVNKQKTAGSSSPSIQAMALACQAIENWQGLGLGRKAADEWLKRVCALARS
jgi:hypothetical protein